MKTKVLVQTSIFSALIAVFGLVQFLGYITIPGLPISITTMPILVFSACLITNNKYSSLVYGLVFGLSSLLVAVFRPVLPTDLLFINPFVSVLPRVVYAFLIIPVYQSISKLTIKRPLLISIVVLLVGIVSYINYVNASFLIFILTLVIGIVVLILTIVTKFNEKINIYLSAFLTWMTHSFLVLLMLYVFYHTKLNDLYGGNAFATLKSIFFTISVLEAVVTSLVATIVVVTVKKVLK